MRVGCTSQILTAKNKAFDVDEFGLFLAGWGLLFYFNFVLLLLLPGLLQKLLDVDVFEVVGKVSVETGLVLGGGGE